MPVIQVNIFFFHEVGLKTLNNFYSIELCDIQNPNFSV